MRGPRACGTGAWKDKILEYSKELGIEDNCVFLGYRKDIAKILQITDVLMHASYREGLTLSVSEAMSFGVPCVVSNVRGNRDLIVDGKGGFVVEPTDDLAFAEKIQEILADENLQIQFGAFNKNRSMDYTVDKVKDQLKEIYNQM